MNIIRSFAGVGFAAALLSIPVVANAQQPAPVPPGSTTETTSSGTTKVTSPTPNGGTVTETRTAATPSGALPPPRSYDEPAPPVASPATPDTGVTKQAGVGGTQAYGRAGVLELGGSMGFAKASDFTQVNLAPSIGWFFMDNLEISGIVGFSYTNTKDSVTGTSASSTFLTALIEPSFHIPFTQGLFGFLGMGGGLGYSNKGGAGLALAPRLGMNILIGRSGILTPALQLVYSTTDVVQTPQGQLLAVSTSFGANIGYTVMW